MEATEEELADYILELSLSIIPLFQFYEQNKNRKFYFEMQQVTASKSKS